MTPNFGKDLEKLPGLQKKDTPNNPNWLINILTAQSVIKNTYQEATFNGVYRFKTLLLNIEPSNLSYVVTLNLNLKRHCFFDY